MHSLIRVMPASPPPSLAPTPPSLHQNENEKRIEGPQHRKFRSAKESWCRSLPTILKLK